MHSIDIWRVVGGEFAEHWDELNMLEVPAARRDPPARSRRAGTAVVSTLSHILAAAALMASAVIYGTDVFCAIVQRPALAQVSDRALTSVMGRIHEYGDRRLPLPGALGITAAALATVTAAIAGHAAAAATAATAVTAQAVWLIIYVRASAPVNRALTAAARAGYVPADARSLQHRWNSVITARAILQAAAAAALCAALAVP